MILNVSLSQVCRQHYYYIVLFFLNYFSVA